MQPIQQSAVGARRSRGRLAYGRGDGLLPDQRPPASEAPRRGAGVYRFTPCRDADVLIRGDELLVNGQSYGRLNPADAVLVDHGVVSVQRRSR